MKNFTKLFLLLITLLFAKSTIAQITLPITFETPGIIYSQIDFAGGRTTILPNPNPSGINTSVSVLQMVKDSDQVYGGSKIELAGFIDFTNLNALKMKVHCPRVNVGILVKFEGPGAQTADNIVFPTVANQWEELTWNFPNLPNNTYNAITFIYDLGIFGNSGPDFTFYQDDISLAQVAGPAQLTLPVTFDDAGTTYGFTDFGGTFTESVVDPANASNTVAKTIRGGTAETYAGTTIGTGGLGFAIPIPFTASNRKMFARVYAPAAGIPVRFKVEVSGQPTQSVETQTLTTVANAWETITFDLNNQASGTAQFDASFPYNVASIFFNFDVPGSVAGVQTYYWDDVNFGNAVGISTLSNDLISIYPNPVSDRITIQLSNELKNSNSTYKIVDLTGRIIASGILNVSEIDVNQLLNGIYSLQINTEKGLINKTFVKQ